MRCAEVIALRGTCARLKVGVIVTDAHGLRVYGVGYNGNAAGLANECDHPDQPGECGCLHAEINALLKSGRVRRGVLYTTHSPCVNCAKAIINAGISRVVFRQLYRSSFGLAVLHQGNVDAIGQPKREEDA